MEEQGNTSKIEIPADGWCWLREDSETGTIRRYWLNGRCIVVMAAQARQLGDVVLSITWQCQAAHASAANTTKCVNTLAEAQLVFDACAIGIHSTLEALGIGCRCLNVPG